MEGNLLEIYYQRVDKEYNDILLTVGNCADYGYVAIEKEINGVNRTVFYKNTETPDDYITPDEEGNTYIDYVTYTEPYKHVAPACSSFKISFADVDKEGSGRNSLTGEMYRERIGKYIKIDLTWDLIPNTIEYNNWYKVLTSLPPFFNAKFLSPNGEIEDKKFYRTDVTTDLYLFISNRQMWKGLATSFVQANVDVYEDKLEPDLLEVTNDGLLSNPVFENGDDLSYGD